MPLCLILHQRHKRDSCALIFSSLIFSLTYSSTVLLDNKSDKKKATIPRQNVVRKRPTVPPPSSQNTNHHPKQTLDSAIPSSSGVWSGPGRGGAVRPHPSSPGRPPPSAYQPQPKPQLPDSLQLKKCHPQKSSINPEIMKRPLR